MAGLPLLLYRSEKISIGPFIGEQDCPNASTLYLPKITVFSKW